jgi:dsDNA-specific endonuclease/ATPase MutS2
LKEREFTARGMECQELGDSDDLSMSIFNWFKPNPRKLALDSVEDDVDPDNPFPDPIEIEITDVFDLHAIQPREVKAVVEEYLLQTRQRNFTTVRIIHGKGIGVQREIVRSVMGATSFVQDWTDAPPEAGGWGATIVRFKK